MEKVRKYAFIIANEAIVPMAFFSCAFAWFNLSQEVSEDFVLMDLYNYPTQYRYWLFIWCPIPISILLVYYHDHAKKSARLIPFLFCAQSFITYRYFIWTINGSSFNPHGVQHMHVFAGPVMLLIMILPLLYAAKWYVYRGATADDAEATLPERALGRKGFLLRIFSWGLVSVSMCLIFAHNPLYFRPAVLVARKCFGVE